MKFKAFFLSSIFLFAIAGSAFANNADLTPSKDLARKIKSELSKVDLDYTQLNGETLKIRFMINERQEIIVLSTDNKKLDFSWRGFFYSFISEEFSKFNETELIQYLNPVGSGPSGNTCPK